jgi:lipoyl(octanoyl) transferase
VEGDRGRPHRKIGALGLRIERGVSYHGIALNVTVDLADFELIDACGMPGVASASIEAEQERAGTPAQTPATVEHAATVFATAFAAELGAPLTGI